MNNQLVEGFLSEFDDSSYPEGFLLGYEMMECLANNEQGETILVKNRETGKLFVAKCYSDATTLSNTCESELLQSIHNNRLPAYVGEYRNDEMVCVIREYVDGIPLDQYAIENPISQEKAVSICAQLCDDLAYLHGQTPPIIHRDIKPQNIVMTDLGIPRLIDFGNSRLYNEKSSTDTVCFGTRYFAAPEQYGFSQTDGRTDTFALGVMLGWLLTGELEIKTAVTRIKDKQLRRIVKKSTEFAPERRYASAARFKTDLLKVINQTKNKVLQWAVRTALCLTLVVSGFSIGRYTQLFAGGLSLSEVHFDEPLIESAVRLELEKPENEPISKDDLYRVTELFIFGDHAIHSYEDFEAVKGQMMLNDGTVQNGGINSLKDLSMLPNLKRVNIGLQNISDLTPLKRLEHLEQLVLLNNPIEDISPLAGHAALRELILFETFVSDLTVISDCPMLQIVDVGKTRVQSLRALSGIKNLNNLYAKKITFDTLSGIEEFSGLQKIGLSSVLDGDLSPLLALPQLKEAHLDEELREAAQNTLEEAHFQILFD